MDIRGQITNSKADLLVSWKDIAAYLKCSVRKAQRLEQRGLPVNRIPGTKSVWALKPDIDRWITAQAHSASLDKDQLKDAAETARGDVPLNSTLPNGFGRFISFYGPLCVLGIFLGLTIASIFAAAYGLTIVLFVLTSASVALIYHRLPDTVYTRALVGLFILAGMSYTASATTLPDVVGSVVNMTVLRPAVAYPFMAGLRFIPIPILISVFLVVLPFRANRGFAHNLHLRMTYVFLGVLLLSTAAIFGPTFAGALRVWHAGLPIRWTLIAGEVFICLTNVALFLAGYRFLNSSTRRYTQFLSRCGIGYLLIALTAAIINRHWYEIDRHYLDIRQAHAYRAHNSNATAELRNWLQVHTADAGTDLMALSRDPEFLHALETQEFYRQEFDEAAQGSRKAVILGYKTGPETQWRHPSFLLVRFPAELAAALGFGLRAPEVPLHHETR